jgi:hypothetical protein
MAEPTKADLEAMLKQRDTEIADLTAKAETEIAELKAQLADQPTPAKPTPAPEVGLATTDLPASRVPPGLAPFNPEQPEVGQYVGHGATSIASSYGAFLVDPATGCITGPVSEK